MVAFSKALLSLFTCVLFVCVLFFVVCWLVGWLVYLVVCLSVYLLRISHKSVICFNTFIEC